MPCVCVSVCAACVSRVYHKTNSTTEIRAKPPRCCRRPFAERQCVELDYRTRRTPDRFRSYQASPAPTPWTPGDVTRSSSSSSAYISSPCDAPPPTPQINRPQIRTALARIKRCRPPPSVASTISFTAATTGRPVGYFLRLYG